MAELRPQFFLVREDNSITPLLALDELPSDFKVRGVPRNLDPADTRGMTSLGTIPSRGAFYVVDTNKDRVGITDTTNDSFTITPHHGGGGKGKHRFSDKKGNGSPNKPTKVYCSYWIRRGECDFEQQGCRFKHVMPTDLETLDTIGLSDIPQWYREKHKLPSLRSGPSFSGLTKGSWRTPQTPPKTTTYHNNVKSAENSEKQGDKAVDNLTTRPRRPSPERSSSKANGFEITGGYPYTKEYEKPLKIPAAEHQCPNVGSSTSLISPASTPSMSHTADSFSPTSSVGGNLWSPSQGMRKRRNFAHPRGQQVRDDKRLGNDDMEPEHRSITELLPHSIPEDRFGNITAERFVPDQAMAHWIWSTCF